MKKKAILVLIIIVAAFAVVFVKHKKESDSQFATGPVKLVLQYSTNGSEWYRFGSIEIPTETITNYVRPDFKTALITNVKATAYLDGHKKARESVKP